MQTQLADKSIEEKLLLADEEVYTTLFSKNPFYKNLDINFKESTFLKKSIGKIYTTEEISSLEKGNLSIESKNINKRQIYYCLRDVKKNPQNPFLLNNLGLAFISAREYKKALKCFNEAILYDSTFISAKLNIAYIYVLLKEYAEAKKIYTDLLNSEPGNKAIKINLANISLIERDLDKAKKLFSEIWTKEKKNTDAGHKLSIIYILNNNGEKAISTLRDCLRIETNNPFLFNTLGLAFLVSGLPNKALNALFTATRLLPRNNKLALNYINLLFDLGKTDSAIKYAENYLDKEYDRNITEILVEMYLKKDEPKLAIREMKKIINESKAVETNEFEIARLYNNLGVIYDRMLEYENAEKMYLSSLKLVNFNNSVFLMNIIDFYIERKQNVIAKSYIDLLEKSFPSKNLHLFYKGILARNEEKFEEAINCLNEFLLVNKEFMYAYITLSGIYCEYLSNYEKAIDVLLNAPTEFKERIPFINDLAYSYLMNNNLMKANEVLKKVKPILNDPFITATRGLLKIKEGKIEEGRKLYNEAKKIARGDILKYQIEQKKHLEIGKYFIGKDKQLALKNLTQTKKLSKHQTIFRKQAIELLESLLIE